jgi:hypothetical protein
MFSLLKKGLKLPIKPRDAIYDIIHFCLYVNDKHCLQQIFCHKSVGIDGTENDGPKVAPMYLGGGYRFHFF